MTDPRAQEASSRRYNCFGVLLLQDGTFAFLGPGYRVVEAGITAERLIELIRTTPSAALYQPQVKRFLAEGGRIERVGPMSADDILKEIG